MLILNICLILVEAVLIFTEDKLSKKNKIKIFCILACSQAILLAGLRHIHIGMDTYNYYNIFERTKDYDWSHIFSLFAPTKMYEAEEIEPGFYLLSKFFQIFSGSFRHFLVFYASLINIPVFILFYKKSSNAVVSVLIYMCLFWAFTIAGLRQTLALIIMSTFGFYALEERKPAKYLLCVVISFFCHKSALICLPFYFLCKIKISRIYITFMLGLSVFLFFFREQFTRLITSFGGWYEQYSIQYENAGTFTFSAVIFLIIFATMFLKDNLKDAPFSTTISTNAILVSATLLPTTFIDPSNLRAVFYFAIFSTLLVPDLINGFKIKRERTLITILIVGLLCLLYFRTNTIYRFFWQPGIYNNLPSIV